MTREKALSLAREFANNPQGVKFASLAKVCNYFFGNARNKSTRHHVYQTPWIGDPRVNIQNSKGYAKAYQVKQVIKAIEKMEEQNESSK